MARIAGVDLPKDKRIEVALTYIYGIGRSLSNQLLSGAGVDPNVRVKDLNEAEIGSIRDALDKGFQVEGELRREVTMHIKRLMEK
jgi:small subunit ribosomal protein S13